nr:fimbria/pilus periplasmic chaperone [Qipengyuania qiaonensis]
MLSLFKTGLVRFLSIALSAQFLLGAHLANALNVQPVIIDLESTGRQTSAIITLQNAFAETAPIEVVVHPVRIVDGELVEFEEEEAENLLVFPSQATVEPGATQAFRVQWIGDPEPENSEHYFVTIAQLPVAFDPNQNAIQVLHRFRVLVSVGRTDGDAELNIVSTSLRTDENGIAQPVIDVQNTGNNYAYVGTNRVTVTQRDETGGVIFREVFQPEDIQHKMGLGLVPSGTTRTLPIGLELPSSNGAVTIEMVQQESD